jgi:hypothetical protein
MEIDISFGFSVDGIVPAHTNIVAGVELGSTLTDDDITGENVLAAITLYAPHLGLAISTIAARTAALLMSHCPPPL